MPRGPRPVIPKIPHHVIHRGNNRQQIFYKNKDYYILIKIIKVAKKEFGGLIYGYCFMKTHIHIIIQPEETNSLSNMMKLIAGRYTRYINKTYDRTGTLWEGRFKSSPIEYEKYLLGCIRYIEMNPMRGGIVNDPKDYFWSSYYARAFGRKDSILDLDPYYLELGKTSEERARAYKKWFKDYITGEEIGYIKEGIERSTPIASVEYINSLSNMIGRKINVNKRGRPR